MTNLHIN